MKANFYVYTKEDIDNLYNNVVNIVKKAFGAAVKDMKLHEEAGFDYIIDISFYTPTVIKSLKFDDRKLDDSVDAILIYAKQLVTKICEQLNIPKEKTNTYINSIVVTYLDPDDLLKDTNQINNLRITIFLLMILIEDKNNSK